MQKAFQKAILKFGVPRRIFVDNGCSYRNNQLDWICAELGIVKIHSKPYHPQGKAKCERSHRTEKDRWMNCTDWNSFHSLEEQKTTLVIVIDEAQYLSRAILADLKLLMNFEMDSRNYAVLVLVGQPTLNNTLSMQIHEALRQRIVVNYQMQGLTVQEVTDYAKNRMRICGVSRDIFEPAALEAACGCCSGSIRRLGMLLHRALIIGCEQKRDTVGTQTMMDASNEIDLI